MTDKLKNDILLMINEATNMTMPPSRVIALTNAIELLVDKELSEAIMEAGTMGEMLKAVGLEIRSKND